MTAAPTHAELGGVAITLGHERVVLLPHRAAWLPEHATLLIADTHWGKSQTFRKAGAPIPRGTTAEQLGRLDAALDATGAEQLLVLGDLIHAPIGITDDLLAEAAAWTRRLRQRRAFEIGLVPGNHDARLGAARLAQFTRDIGITLHPEDHRLGGLHLRHIPDVPGPTPVIGGHHHPAVSLDASQFPLKVPVFWMPDHDILVLPAFSAFTAGMSITPGRSGVGVFPIAEGRVVPLRSPPVS